MRLCRLQDESVDLVFADTPFNVGKKYGGYNNDNRKDYYDWCSKWITKGFRLLKPTGTFYLMTLDRHQFKIGVMMEKHGFFINNIKWKNVSNGHETKHFWPACQPILMFGKSSDYKFNTYAQYRKTTLPWNNKRQINMKGQLLDYWDDIPFVYAGSIKHPEAILLPGTNKKVHPCQMPINLIVRCVVFSTDEADIVLDPFLGSGTTAVAAEKLDRKWIGIEINSEYCKIAEKRILDERRQLRLDFETDADQEQPVVEQLEMSL